MLQGGPRAPQGGFPVTWGTVPALPFVTGPLHRPEGVAQEVLTPDSEGGWGGAWRNPQVALGGAYSPCVVVFQFHSDPLSAINACYDGDTVIVCPGRYMVPGSFSIADSIELEGECGRSQTGALMRDTRQNTPNHPPGARARRSRDCGAALCGMVCAGKTST